MTVEKSGKACREWRSGALRLLAQYSPLVIFAVLCVVLAVLEPDFRKPDNLTAVAQRTCVVGIVAIGSTLVIISGGIDLSVGSVAALSGIIGALAMTKWQLPMPVGVALGTLTGLLCGFINGLLTTKGRLPAFIATLGMMMAARGATFLISGGENVYRLPASFRVLSGSQGRWVPIAITLGIALFFAITLTFTRYGRSLFATGGNAAGARLSGVPVDRVRMIAFSAAGMLTGFAGMMLTSRTGIGAPKAAEGMELDAIAACVIGGASLMGGEGGVLGSLAGALIMNVLVNFFTLSEYDVYWQNVLIGCLIIGLVFYDTQRKRRAGLIKDV